MFRNISGLKSTQGGRHLHQQRKARREIAGFFCLERTGRWAFGRSNVHFGCPERFKSVGSLEGPTPIGRPLVARLRKRSDQKDTIFKQK